MPYVFINIYMWLKSEKYQKPHENWFNISIRGPFEAKFSFFVLWGSSAPQHPFFRGGCTPHNPGYLSGLDSWIRLPHGSTGLRAVVS